MATRKQSRRAAARGNGGVSDASGDARPQGVGSESPQVAAAATAAPAVTRVGSALSIRTAAQLAEELRAALRAGAVRVDAANVEIVDTAGVQLIVATVASAAARGVPFEWLGVSGALREAAMHLGLVDMLRLPATA